MRKIIIIILIVAVVATPIVYIAGKHFLLNKLKIFIKEKVEESGRGITIEDIGYRPLKGIRIKGITGYSDILYKEKEFHVSAVYVSFPIIELLIDKILSATVAIDSLEFKNTSLNGSFGFVFKVDKKIKKPRDILYALEGVKFKNLSIESLLASVKNLNGTIDISPTLIRTKNTQFILNDRLYKLSLEVTDPVGELSSKLAITSPGFNFNASANKENDVYKIQEMRGKLLDSSFEFMGEVANTNKWILSLYGTTSVELGDIIQFAPETFDKAIAVLKPVGRIDSSVYFKGNIKNPSVYELGIKSKADYVKIWKLRIDKPYMDMRAENGLISIPIISGYPYEGTMTSSAQIDLRNGYKPYKANFNLSNFNIASFLRNSNLSNKSIRGLVSSKFTIQGDATDTNSMEGVGRILISNANLGPMPLLTPLLGNAYGYLQYALPELRRIDITDGTCDFYVGNRKISTENLTLWGEAMSIHAKGYMDFDTNLNFVAENKFFEKEGEKEASWQTDLEDIISGVGRMVGRSHLTGTLAKPKWKFEYMEDAQNGLKGLGKVLKGIFE